MLQTIQFPKDKIDYQLKITPEQENNVLIWEEEDDQNKPSFNENYTISNRDGIKYLSDFNPNTRSIIDNSIQHILVAFDINSYFECQDYITKQSDRDTYAICVLSDITFSDDASNISFKNSIFRKQVSIKFPVNSNIQIGFENCLFCDKLDVSSDFPISLKNCIVYQDVTLKNSNAIHIHKCGFLGDIILEKNTNIYIEKTRCKASCTISNTKSNDQDNVIELSEVNIEETFTIKSTKTKFLKMYKSEIQKISFEKMDVQFLTDNQNTIKSAGAYQDFTTLKNFAISNKNNIQALEYITQEMNTHLEGLKSDKKYTINRFILTFEKYTSFFGSQPIMPAIWLILFMYAKYVFLNFEDIQIKTNIEYIYIGVFVSLILCGTWHLEKIAKSVKIQFLIFIALVIATLCHNPFESFILLQKVLGSPIDVKDVKPYEMTWILVEIVIASALIYEIIKSFRKYSRQL